MIVPIILAGGVGARLWPRSRASFPKQFCQLLGNYSFFQQAIKRVYGTSQVLPPVVVTNDDYFFLCQDQLKDLQIEDAYFLLEPCSRNTAPAVGLAAHHVRKLYGDAVTMLVMPADHYIPDEAAFQQAIKELLPTVEQGYLGAIGIQPRSASVGYGYIKAGSPINSAVSCVECFVEKPDLTTAEAYVASKLYCWNSGIFMFQPSTYLDALSQHASDIATVLEQVYNSADHHDTFLRVDQHQFQLCRSESIDYAVMEHARNIVMLRFESSWSDLGCWSSLAKSAAEDESGNVINGHVIVENTQNCMVDADGRFVAMIGMTDTIVITTDDAVLVSSKSHSQDVKKIVEQLKAQSCDLAIQHKRVYRPWGYYEQLAAGPGFQVKRLVVKPGAKLSLQMHYHRSEHWVVVSGKADIVNGKQQFELLPNQSTYIAKEVKHRLSNKSQAPLHVIEVQSGDYLGEDDIVRFDDVYGRAPQQEMPVIEAMSEGSIC